MFLIDFKITQEMESVGTLLVVIFSIPGEVCMDSLS
jgi:hypothetical protein